MQIKFSSKFKPSGLTYELHPNLENSHFLCGFFFLHIYFPFYFPPTYTSSCFILFLFPVKSDCPSSSPSYFSMFPKTQAPQCSFDIQAGTGGEQKPWEITTFLVPSDEYWAKQDICLGLGKLTWLKTLVAEHIHLPSLSISVKYNYAKYIYLQVSTISIFGFQVYLCSVLHILLLCQEVKIPHCMTKINQISLKVNFPFYQLTNFW